MSFMCLSEALREVGSSPCGFPKESRAVGSELRMGTASVSGCQSVTVGLNVQPRGVGEHCLCLELVALPWGEAGKGGCDVLGCCFLLSLLAKGISCALGQIKCCGKVTHCDLWGVKGVVYSWMLKDSLESLLLFLYLFLHWQSRPGL